MRACSSASASAAASSRRCRRRVVSATLRLQATTRVGGTAMIAIAAEQRRPSGVVGERGEERERSRRAVRTIKRPLGLERAGVQDGQGIEEEERARRAAAGRDEPGREADPDVVAGVQAVRRDPTGAGQHGECAAHRRATRRRSAPRRRGRPSPGSAAR